jgi:hypothetical protein
MTNDLLRRLSSKRKAMDSGLVGLQGMRNTSAFRNSPLWQMRVLTASGRARRYAEGSTLSMPTFCFFAGQPVYPMRRGEQSGHDRGVAPPLRCPMTCRQGLRCASQFVGSLLGC